MFERLYLHDISILRDINDFTYFACQIIPFIVCLNLETT